MSTRKTTVFSGVLIAVIFFVVGMVLASRMDLSPQSAAQTVATTSVRAAKVADLNGDGLDDLVVVPTASNTMTALINQTSPGNNAVLFAAETSMGQTNAGSLTIADFNGDGRPDVLAGLRAGGALFFNTTTLASSVASFAGGTFGASDFRDSALYDATHEHVLRNRKTAGA